MNINRILGKLIKRRTSQADNAIPMKAIETMFSRMSRQSNFDATGELLWGFFFIHSRPEPLINLRDELVSSGYTFVDICSTDDEESFRLHVERIEIHSPETLYDRCAYLGELAKQYMIEGYDGFDVGPVRPASA